MRDWQEYALAVFAVAAGQVLRLGQKIEAGKPISWRDIFVLCSMLPAFGSLIGAAGVHYSLPVYQIILASLTAGWVGFGFMRLLLALLPNLVPEWAAKILRDAFGRKPD